jgi:hypothetical protein
MEGLFLPAVGDHESRTYATDLRYRHDELLHHSHVKIQNNKCEMYALTLALSLRRERENIFKAISP